MNEELRCYTFTHFALKGIQQGIQSGHAAMELVNKYTVREGWINGFAEQVLSWVGEHKTIICLDGGNSASLKDLLDFLLKPENPFPVTSFYEDEQTMEGMLTSIATVLPARIFEGAQALRNHKRDDSVSVSFDPLSRELHITYNVNTNDAHDIVFNEWERELMERLGSMRLAG